jgi:hypothetical protein
MEAFLPVLRTRLRVHLESFLNNMEEQWASCHVDALVVMDKSRHRLSRDAQFRWIEP